MGQLLSNIVEAVGDLRLGDKLFPWRNAAIAWFWVWLPAACGYLSLLMAFINSKPTIGSFEISPGHEAAMEKLFYLSTPRLVRMNPIEVIAQKSVWSEGPLWVQDEGASLSYLLYSDTVLNKIFRWEEGKGFFTVGRTIHQHNSGCATLKSDGSNSSSISNSTTSSSSYCAEMYEPGSNGLIRIHPRLLPKNAPTPIDLLVAQHGERALGLLRENGTRSHVATHYKGKRFNSPNDMVYSPEGHLYFTDPPYGLYSRSREMRADLQELDFCGVYMISAGDLQQAIESGQPTANVRLLHDGLSRPNGLAFSPDFSKMYVSNSDRASPTITVFDVSSSGALTNARVFFDASSLLGASQQPPSLSTSCRGDNLAGDEGECTASAAAAAAAATEQADGANPTGLGVPDGLKVDIHGNVLASGPGGLLVLSPTGELLGRLLLPDPVSNVAFGGDGRLYITSAGRVARVRVRTRSSPLGQHSKR